MKRIWLLLLGSILLGCAVAWPFARAHLQAIAVMREVSGQPVPAFVKALTVPVTTQDVSFPIETEGRQRLVRARLYLPQVGR